MTKENAVKKLNDGRKEVSGSKEKAMENAVYDALATFCRQDEEFAKAVEQGGSFKDCMEAVAKGVGSSISDLQAYKKAVKFYFPSADVSFQMKIDMRTSVKEAEQEESQEPEPTTSQKIISLEDFF